MEHIFIIFFMCGLTFKLLEAASEGANMEAPLSLTRQSPIFNVSKFSSKWTH